MERKFRDKVEIRKDLEVGNQYGSCPFLQGMATFIGLKTEIAFVQLGHYELAIDAGRYCWTDEMLVPKV
jgi:hypothetical protein